jgi:hypothetical protein
MLIVPDGTPASVRTFVWLRLIVVVEPSPSSTLTSDIDIVPVGVGIGDTPLLNNTRIKKIP